MSVKPSNRWQRPAVREHRSHEHVRHHRDHRAEHRPRTVAELLERFRHHRHESSFESRPMERDHRRPSLDGNYPQQPRPIEDYPGYTGPSQYPPVGDPGFTPPANYGPGQYPDVGDPGFTLPNASDPGYTAPTYGPQLPPNGVDAAPVYGPQLPGAYVKDQSMYDALGALDASKGPVSGKQMGEAIWRGVSDADGKGNSTELQQLKDWLQQNAGRLTPAAKMAAKSYVDIAEASAARGAPGLTGAEMNLLRKRLRGADLADGLE